MLHTNLSTRPFYNTRAVQAVLGGLAALVLVATVFDAVQLLRLSSRERTSGSHAASAEADAARLQREAATMRARIDPKEVTVVSDEAREANAIIDQRTFSWTDLFMQFEDTLPDDVRVVAVTPRLDHGVFGISLQVEAQRVEDVEAFIEALEAKGAFRGVLPKQEQVGEDGLIEAVVEGVYTPHADETATAARPQPEATP